MKKTIILLLTALHIVSSTFGQTKKSKVSELEVQLIALEKGGWEAWKNKDVSWFQHNTTNECLWINAEGISNKTQMIQSIPTDCTVKTVSPGNFKFVRLNKKTVLLTYNTTQDGYCGNKKLTENIKASVCYVKRGGKWLEAFYMETPVVQ